MISVLTLAVLIGSSGQPILPDHGLTPGAVLTTDSGVVCVSGYTQTVRNVPISEKIAVEAAYHARYPQVVYAHGKQEYDHLISLELGGSNDERNLWPEVYADHWGAHVKDKLEKFLHAEVCSGRMTLPKAQRLISTDWIQTYKRFLGQP